MSAPAAVRNNHLDFFTSSALPALDEVFVSSYERHPSLREKLFQVKSMDRDIAQYSEQHDLPLFSEMEEGEEYSYKRAKQGANKTYTAVKYGLGASFSEELIDDGKFDFVADALRKMGRSGRESQEITAMNVINNGFSSETTADGVSIFNDAHTLPSGGTWRNQLSTAADLSPDSLEQALIDFEEQPIGDSGIQYAIKPKVLLVPTGLKRYAQEIVGSDRKADSADNNMNSLKEDGLIVVSSVHLTDADAWFLLADKSDCGLRIYSRQGMMTKSAVDFDTDSIKYKSRYREVIGASHAMGIFGTAGAN